MQHECDFLVIGGGIAGLTAAREAGKFGKVILLTKGKIGESATEKAQGGIAAAIDQIEDSTEFHFEDTIAAGAGLCDEKAVRILVTEGVDRVKELIEMGARFDRAETEAGGGYALALEGAHKRRRILHAGDETGAEIEKTLGRKVVSEGKVEIHQQIMGMDLITDGDRCLGATALDLKTGKKTNYLAKATILATGGTCQVYLYTTNPTFATGDGIAMAYRAGAEVCDMEFVQFHPTALVQFKEFEDIIALPRFLISEAVRGEGGMLLNEQGERFIQELAPRDVVSRGIVQEMQKSGADHVYLSLRKMDPAKISRRFPVIYQTCLERGLDITKDNIPVAPAAHFFMGGIRTGMNAETSLKTLYAAGECASTGVHGANRLASNSLLEGLVFGYRAAQAAKDKLQPPTSNFQINLNSANIKPILKEVEINRYKLVIKTAMWKGTGIVRSKESILESQKKLALLEKQLNFQPSSLGELEIFNMLEVAKLITRGALEREESRGAHFRTDFPERNDRDWNRHLIYKVSR